MLPYKVLFLSLAFQILFDSRNLTTSRRTLKAHGSDHLALSTRFILINCLIKYTRLVGNGGHLSYEVILSVQKNQC